MAKEKRKIKGKAVDFTLLLVTLLLVFVGIIMVFSSSWPEGMKVYSDGYHFFKRQVIFSILGLMGLIGFMNLDYGILKKQSFWIYLLGLGLGLLLFTPLGHEVKGATRWLKIGPLTFMPSDAIKMGSIIFFANFLSNKKKEINTFKQGTLPALIIIGISCGAIYVQRDLGTTVTLAGTMMTMFIIAGMEMKHFASLLGFVSASAFFIFKQAKNNPESKNAYRVRRIISFKDPFLDKQGDGFQAVQSLYALGSGGLFGLGLGKSRQKFFYLPEPHNDFIFAIIGEELGFIGAVLVIGLYLILIGRGMKIASAAKDSYGTYLAIGITTLIGLQALIHIAVVTSSIPTTGITLPLISYGGTSLIIYMCAIGILLNISRHGETNRS